MKKFFLKSSLALILSVCVIGVVHTNSEAKSNAAEAKWSMEKDTVVSRKGVKYHVYFSKDKNECWVHKVVVKSKRVTKLNFPQKIKNKKLTTIGAMSELYPDDNAEHQIDACVNIMGEVFEPWHETGADAKTNILSVKIPDTVKVLGDSSLAGLKKCKRVQLSSNITYIGYYEFYDDRALEQIEVAGKCKEIRKNAFMNCRALKTIKLGKKVSTVDSKAFYKCYKLSRVTVHKKNNNLFSKKGMLLTKNKKELLCASRGMKKIKIPKGVTTIANEVFCDSKIKEIWIPASLKKVGAQAFHLTNIKKWNIAKGSAFVKTKTCVYSKESGELIYLFYSPSAVKLPEKVTRIGLALSLERGKVNKTVVLPKKLQEVEISDDNQNFLNMCSNLYFSSSEPPKVISNEYSLGYSFIPYIPVNSEENYLNWLEKNFYFNREKEDYRTFSTFKPEKAINRPAK